MPPRKSNISQVSSATVDEGTPVKERDGVNIEDLSLPRTMVQRLAKGVLPPNTSLHKDAILAMSKGATVFINYLAHAANTASLADNKRTIPPTAVLEALSELEFHSFGPRVEAELKRFNEVQTGKRNEYRRKVKAEKMGGGKEEDEGEARAAKRARRDRDGSMEEEGSEPRAGEDPSAQLRTGCVEREDEDGDAEEDGVADDGTGGYEVGRRPSQGEDEEDEEDDEEAEDDDEDEYPDEGRRLSSVERETNTSFGRPRDDSGSSGTSGTSGDEELSDY